MIEVTYYNIRIIKELKKKEGFPINIKSHLIF